MLDDEVSQLAARFGWSDEELALVQALVWRATLAPPSEPPAAASPPGASATVDPAASMTAEGPPPADAGSPDARAPGSRPGGPASPDARARAALVGPPPAWLPTPPPPGAPPPLAPPRRYEDLGPLGVGGMGEVRRVRDATLGRTMAMKVLRPGMLDRPATVARFVAEAQCAAQLQHPGIVPVHELGRLPDGRVYFTMREVRGRTLAEVVGAVHAVSPGHWGEAAGGWGLRRLLDAFLRVCEAVAYAHARGVVHRDLKPANVMIGEHGEVLVLDWGLAKVTGRPDLAAEAARTEAASAAPDAPVVTDRSRDEAQVTRAGVVAGTPAYMPPEQARGDLAATDTRGDIYSLGAVLYEVLSGRPPYAGSGGAEVVAAVLAGPPSPVQSPGAPPVPEELAVACARAMARDPAERFPTADALAAEIRGWLDGVRRRDRALAVVDEAAERAAEARRMRAEARGLRAHAEQVLAGIPPWRPEADKVEGWALEDEATALEQRAAQAELEEEHLLRGSLTHAPDLPEAHEALVARHAAALADVETRRGDATLALAQLRLHADALPPGHPARGRLSALLAGDGAFTLVTDPPGAEVLLHRYELHHRRLVPRFVRSLGRTPLRAVPLPMGSYLCVLRHPAHGDTAYPVSIGRGQHWDGVAPGESAPRPVPLRPRLRPDEAWVTPGWFLSGGDDDAPGSLPRRRLWSEGLVVQRDAVTVAAFITFLEDLVRQGRTAEAMRHVPQERGVPGQSSISLLGFDGARFHPQADPDGDEWLPDQPVVMVDLPAALAYAAWLADREGLPWRLPGELEWEKAARGVDGRSYPWGDWLDPSWCRVKESLPGRSRPAPVGQYPVDTSPYGVAEMAGNARDWCADRYSPDGPMTAGDRVLAPPAPPADIGVEDLYVVRGGSWGSSRRYARVADRFRHAATYRTYHLGFRLVRSLDG